VGFDDGTVNENQAVFALLRQGIENAFPEPAPGPADIAIINRCVRPLSRRQIAPRRASAQNIKDAVQDFPVIDTRRTSPARREMRLNSSPFCIRQIKPAHGVLREQTEADLLQ
jgi:hypothetical protein